MRSTTGAADRAPMRSKRDGPDRSGASFDVATQASNQSVAADAGAGCAVSLSTANGAPSSGGHAALLAPTVAASGSPLTE